MVCFDSELSHNFLWDSNLTLLTTKCVNAAMSLVENDIWYQQQSILFKGGKLTSWGNSLKSSTGCVLFQCQICTNGQMDNITLRGNGIDKSMQYISMLPAWSEGL